MKAWQIIRTKDNLACDPPYESMLDACKAMDERQYPLFAYICKRVTLKPGNCFIAAETNNLTTF